MAKKIKSLEKDSYEYRIKYEKCNKALLDMATDKQSQDQYVAKTARQISQMQKLCRTLQADRTVLCELLKTNNIERPSLPELPPEPKDIEAPPKTSDKLDIMSRNCDELKRTLAQLQGQMNAVTEKTKADSAAAAAAPVAPANKKNKNKKNKVKSATKAKEPNATVNEQLQSETLNKLSDSIDDQPLAELVTKVLAENPPPLDLLESVLSAEGLAEILMKADEDEEGDKYVEQQLANAEQQLLTKENEQNDVVAEPNK